MKKGAKHKSGSDVQIVTDIEASWTKLILYL